MKELKTRNSEKKAERSTVPRAVKETIALELALIRTFQKSRHSKELADS